MNVRLNLKRVNETMLRNAAKPLLAQRMTRVRNSAPIR